MAGGGVGAGGGGLDVGEGRDGCFWGAPTGDGEFFQGRWGLRPPQRVGGDAHLTHRVVFHSVFHALYRPPTRGVSAGQGAEITGAEGTEQLDRLVHPAQAREGARLLVPVADS